MRTAFILLAFFLVTPGPRIALGHDMAGLNESNIAPFLVDYQKQLATIESLYQQLANLQPPLRNRSEQPINFESFEDREKTIPYFRQTVREIQSNPHDFVLVLRLLIQTETLTDDLNGLSQICFDNDQEELAQHLNQLALNMEHNKHLTEGYALHLADEVEQRIEKLDAENRELRSRLHGAKKPTERPPHPPAP